jgi:hypothetical protein
MTDLLTSLRTLVEAHALELWATTVFILVFLALGLVVQGARLKRMMDHYRTLTEGVNGRHLEEVLNQHLANVAQVQGEMQRSHQRVQELIQHEQRCFQNIGFVRYDAFDDVGGQQSFVVAVLDAHYNGFVLNSLVGRQEMRVFAKQIVEGACEQYLSEEEQQALESARRSNFVPSGP